MYHRDTDTHRAKADGPQSPSLTPCSLLSVLSLCVPPNSLSLMQSLMFPCVKQSCVYITCTAHAWTCMSLDFPAPGSEKGPC